MFLNEETPTCYEKPSNLCLSCGHLKAKRKQIENKLLHHYKNSELATLVNGYFFRHSQLFFHISLQPSFSHFNNNLLCTNLNLAKLIHKGSHRMSVGKSNNNNAGRQKKKGIRCSFEKFSEL